MEDELYDALIGADISKTAKAKVIAEALRRRSDIGLLGQVSGDKVLAPVGKQMSQQADQYATDLQGIRQSGIEEEQKNRQLGQTKAYQDEQLRLMGTGQTEDKRWHNLQYLMNDRDNAARLAAAQSKKFKTIPGSTKLKAVAARQGLSVLQEMEKTFKDSYAGQKNFPGWNALKNKAVANQVGTDKFLKENEPQQAWYANLDRLYNLQERYKLFGATLTNNEFKSWLETNINPNMSAAQIRNKLETLKVSALNELDLAREGYDTEEFNPEEVEGTFGAGGGGFQTSDSGGHRGAGKVLRRNAEGKWE